MRVIQVRARRADFAATLGKMRNWLDARGRPLVRFETSTEGDSILLRVTFDSDALAEEFLQDFGGDAVG
jgi:hypothetical protein